MILATLAVSACLVGIISPPGLIAENWPATQPSTDGGAGGAVAGDEPGCPADFPERFGRMCSTGWKRAASWYAADATCRSMGADLLSPATSSDVSAMRDLGGDAFWTGRHREGDKWVWSDGRDILELPTSVELDPTTAVNADCMAMRYVGRTAHMAHEKCGRNLKFKCTLGDVMCSWEVEHLFFTAELPNGEKANLKVAGGVVSMDGVDVGSGEWVAPDRFRVKSTELPCTVVAVFKKTSYTSVKTGCEKADGSVELVSASFSGEPPCITSILPPTPPTRSPTPSPRVPLTETPPGPRATSAPGQTESAVVVETRSSVPVWVWPIAFVVVGLVSVMAGVGASRRRAKKESQSSDDDAKSEPRKYDPEAKCDPEAAALCDTCRKFNIDMARERLCAVHEALQREFVRPLNIMETRCDHIGGDHVHVFRVENGFDASSLGALSTVYSRTKPRLPRNTRIHIERVSDAELPENQQTCPDENTGYDDAMAAAMWS